MHVGISVVTVACLGTTNQTSASKHFQSSKEEEAIKEIEVKDQSPDLNPEEDPDLGTAGGVTDKIPTQGG